MGDWTMNVSEQLNSLPEMNKAALHALWQEHFGAVPSKNSVLIEAIDLTGPTCSLSRPPCRQFSASCFSLFAARCAPALPCTLRSWLCAISFWCCSVLPMVDGFACGLQIAFSGSGYPIYGKVGVCHFGSSNRKPSLPGIGKDFACTGHGRAEHATARPCTSREIQELIKRMSMANPRWGAPRIHGELQKLGIQVSECTVAKYMVLPRRPSSQTWRTFLKNHTRDLVSTDFFVVPTATLRLLFVFLMLSHDRRRIVHFGVTSHPTAEWTAQQLHHAFPWDTAPRYILHDRDSCYGEPFHQTAQALNIQEILSAPRSPWQNAYVERLISSIRRDCLDHVLIFNQRGLRRMLQLYLDYYERSRTHLSLAKDAPIPRSVQPPSLGRVIELSQVGGLHHRYERQAA
jgi:putative transposase